MFINPKISLQKKATTPVITSAKPIASHILLATYFLSDASSCAPKAFATGIVNPPQTPMQKPIIIKLIEPVLPTAASASGPKNLPTIIVSTIL